VPEGEHPAQRTSQRKATGMASDSQDAQTDPGRLGRRVAARRRELGLTLEEAAERASMAPDYLHRVETDPGAVLRTQALGKLARALETTGADLLNTANASGGPPNLQMYHQLVPIDEATCWEHLSRGGLGRLIFDSERGPTALPVIYRVMGHSIVFRTDSSSHLGRLAGHMHVGFEADNFDATVATGWSVFVSGSVRRLGDENELAAVCRLDTGPWADGGVATYLLLEVTEVTGRRVDNGADQPAR
jgi:transcriptional regulator with XRE-family HTH domain